MKMAALSLAPLHDFFKSNNSFVFNSVPCCQTCSIRLSAARATLQLSSTHQLFDEIPLSDTFAWNNLIQTHLAHKDPLAVLFVYNQMLLRRVPPDNHTFPRVLTACRLSRNLPLARQVHGHAVKLGFSSDQYVISALIHVYGCLHSVSTAKCLFDKTACRSSVSWTLLAKLYIMENKPGLAIDMFHQMVDLNYRIDHVALAMAIAACTMLKSLQQGKIVHEIAMKYGLDSNILVSNSLLKMYTDCERLQEARAVFNGMESKDIISWTEMICGYVKKGRFNEGLKLFRQMNGDGIRPDSLSVSSVLPACARMAAHKQGKEIHAYLLKNGFELNITVQNAIMDMYVKSGFIELASRVFAGMKKRDVISLTVITIGYSLHGQGELAVELFRKMEELEVEIDKFSQAAALLACSATLMVDKGRYYFNGIKEPEVGHYALMVSLLARSGLFHEARTFMEEHVIERQTEVLKALLDGCRIHRQEKLGKQIMEQLINLEPLNADNYVILSNWYANNDKWDKVNEVQQSIRDMGLKPRKAYSWIEFKNKVHVFGTGDVSHPRSERIYWELQCLTKEMEGNEYKLIRDFSLHDVDEERECIQIGHSELLAISFGLVSTQASTIIRVTKNLNVCRGCHDFAKFISKMVNREIILKDPTGFHHFKNGCCSCRDFWYGAKNI